MKTRKINKVFHSKPTLEGAGVHLKRAFGFNELPLFDPFLMLDDFRINERSKFIKGFPWHPHRGIETVTYILEGCVEHKDSMGNGGIIASGDVQWMTAGSGIIHQEMPKGNVEEKMYGFQLWSNLPAKSKMMPPRYRDIKASMIPEIISENGVKIKIICGNINGASGPVQEIISDPQYLDITIPSGTQYIHQTPSDYNVFTYIIEGSCYIDSDESVSHGNETLVLFEQGDKLHISTKEESVRLLFLCGKPLNEPIAWGGPIVMNTQQELEQAFVEYDNGTFIKH